MDSAVARSHSSSFLFSLYLVFFLLSLVEYIVFNWQSICVHVRARIFCLAFYFFTLMGAAVWVTFFSSVAIRPFDMDTSIQRKMNCNSSGNAIKLIDITMRCVDLSHEIVSAVLACEPISVLERV